MATSPGRRSSCRAHLEVVQHARELVAAPAPARDRRRPDARARPAPSAAPPATARVERLGAGEHPRRAAMRGGEERAALGGQAPAQRSRIAARPRAHAIDLVQDEVGVLGLPQRRAPPPRRRRPLDARALTSSAVGQLRSRASLPGVRSQASRSSALPRRQQRAAQQRDEAAPERGVPERRCVRSSAYGDLELAEDLLEQRGVLARLAQDDRDRPPARSARSPIRRATWAATSSSSARSPPPSSSISASPGSGSTRTRAARTASRSSVMQGSRAAARSARRARRQLDVLGGRAP